MMLKYILIIKNSYKQDNVSFIGILFSLLEPVVQVAGLLFFYAYIESNGGALPQTTLLYFLFILVCSSIEFRTFGSRIKQEIQQENYLNINRMPLNPFMYYLAQSIGRNILVFSILFIASLVYLMFTGYPLIGMLLYSFGICCSIIMVHLISFLTLTIAFVNPQINTWLFGIIFDFLSGKLVPIKYFPQVIQQTFFVLLPFGYAYGSLAKSISTMDFKGMTIGISLCIVWIFLLFFVSNKLWEKGSYAFQER